MRAFKIALLLAATMAAAAHAQGPARDAQATRNALEEVRVLKGINRAAFTPEQGATLYRIVDGWDRQRTAQEVAVAAQLTEAAKSLRESLARIEQNPTQELPAESSLQTTRSSHLSKLRELQRAPREQLVQLLQSLTGTQAQNLLTAAREAMLADRLDPGTDEGRRSLQGSLNDLERLRTADPQRYEREREFTARRYAGAFGQGRGPGGPGGGGFGGPGGGQGGPGAQGGGQAAPGGQVTQGGPGGPGGARGPGGQAGPGGQGGPRRGPGGPGGPVGFGPNFQLPAIQDPQVAQRVARYAATFDRVRALPAPAFQQQSAQLAGQLAREREIARAQAADPRELIPLFVDAYLLQPRSGAALQARFGDK